MVIAAHLTHWAPPAGWMFVLLCTCSCPRPPLLQRWWSSCHLRPDAWGSGSEQFLVCPTQSSTQQWSLTQLCTSAARILRGRLLTLGATRTQQSLEDLQENNNSIGVFRLLMTDILYLCVMITSAVPWSESTWRTNAARPEIRTKCFTETVDFLKHIYICILPQIVPVTSGTFWVHYVFSILCHSWVKCISMNTTGSSDGLFPHGCMPGSQSWSTAVFYII